MILKFLYVQVFYLYESTLYMFWYLGSLETAVTGGCKAPCWYWELNPGFLQEQPVPFLRPPNYFFEPYPRVLRAFFNLKVFYQKLFSKHYQITY